MIWRTRLTNPAVSVGISIPSTFCFTLNLHAIAPPNQAVERQAAANPRRHAHAACPVGGRTRRSHFASSGPRGIRRNAADRSEAAAQAQALLLLPGRCVFGRMLLCAAGRAARAERAGAAASRRREVRREMGARRVGTQVPRREPIVDNARTLGAAGRVVDLGLQLGIRELAERQPLRRLREIQSASKSPASILNGSHPSFPRHFAGRGSSRQPERLPQPMRAASVAPAPSEFRTTAERAHHPLMKPFTPKERGTS